MNRLQRLGLFATAAATFLVLPTALAQEATPEAPASDTGSTLMLNGSAQVIVADIQLANGVMHVIDTVLVPPTAPDAATEGEATDEASAGSLTDQTSAATEALATSQAQASEALASAQQQAAESLATAQAQIGGQTDVDDELDAADAMLEALGLDDVSSDRTIAEVLLLSPQFSTLQFALNAAGLTSTFDDEAGTYTLFAPTNEAFDAFLAESGLTVNDLLTSPDLSNVLSYHVLPEVLLASDLAAQSEVTALNGEIITLSMGGMMPTGMDDDADDDSDDDTDDDADDDSDDDTDEDSDEDDDA